MRVFIISLFALALVACDSADAQSSATAPAPSAAPAAAAAAGSFSVSTDPAHVAKGKELFASKTCSACHQMNAKVVGPPLAGVTKRRSADWLGQMITKPSAFMKSDPEAKKLLEEYKTPMPDLGITPDEANAIIAYLASQG